MKTRRGFIKTLGLALPALFLPWKSPQEATDVSVEIESQFLDLYSKEPIPNLSEEAGRYFSNVYENLDNWVEYTNPLGKVIRFPKDRVRELFDKGYKLHDVRVYTSTGWRSRW